MRQQDMAASIAFDEIGRNADRAFAYALLARLASKYVVAAYRLYGVATPLERVLNMLGPQEVEQLATDDSEKAAQLRNRLEELHGVLAEFSGSDHVSTLSTSRLPIITRLVRRIQGNTEDLGDIIENMALTRDADFASLVSSCASSLGLGHSGDVVASMHD